MFIIHSDLLAVEMDLPKAYQATRIIEQTLGTDSPSDAHFDALTGTSASPSTRTARRR